MNDKWVERWVVPSESGNGEYIVSKDKDGNYACSCIGWTRHFPRRDCKHIDYVRCGGATTLSQASINRLAGRG